MLDIYIMYTCVCTVCVCVCMCIYTTQVVFGLRFYYSFISLINNIRKGIKTVEEQDAELTSSHKYVRNTSTREMICTEHQLNASKRTYGLKMARNPPHNWVGQRKGEEEERIRTALHPREELQEDQFPPPGKSPLLVERSA